MSYFDDEKNASPEGFQKMVPRTIFAESDQARENKKGEGFTGGYGYGFNNSLLATAAGSGSNIYRNPSRRFYDPEITTTAIYLPRNIRQKNRWCRWFFDHDELIGAVLELHADLPYSRAEIMVDDPKIKRHVEECFDLTKFFSLLPIMDLEFMKIGEVFVHTPWDNAKGMWSHIILHNPDFVEVTATPFADTECVIEITPDDELRKIIHSTKPEDQQLKKRLPKDVVRRVLTGKNILLDSNEVTHLARRSNPYDIRGTSLLNRMFRLLMYEDKLREAQMTIADNFIYPLKVFKLGDPNKGWIPDESHQRALAQMLQSAHFDPNFALIYHYGLQIDYVTVADKILRLDKEHQEINERKMIALGVSKEFISGASTYASANVGLQIQLAKYKAKRDLFEVRWIMDKFMRIMAERNEWYKRDAKEIVGQYRVARKGDELKRRLILPKLAWHKKLMMRDDQQFLTFLHNVYSQGKGPISALTLLMAMGLDTEDELHKKRQQEKLEDMIGAHIQTPAPTPGGAPGGGLPGLGALAKIRDKFRKDKVSEKQPQQEKIESVEVSEREAGEFIKGGDLAPKAIPIHRALANEIENDLDLTQDILPVNDAVWQSNIRSANIQPEVIIAITNYDTKLQAIDKKNNGEFKDGVIKEVDSLQQALVDMYIQGKLTAYGWTDYLPASRNSFAGEDKKLRDYSDIVLAGEFKDWVEDISKIDMDKGKMYRHLRDIANTCYCYGQLKGFQEQGIYTVKISNSLRMDGLRYRVEELTKKGKNLSSLISPDGEIVLFAPCIEGFDGEELGNMIDDTIKRYADISVSGIRVKDCPTEYKPFVERYLNKLGKYLKKHHDNILFIKDVVDLPEWENEQKLVIAEELKDIPDESKEYLINAKHAQLKLQKMGKVPVFSYKRNLCVSNWIGAEDSSIIDSLLKYIPAEDDSLVKAVEKSFNISGNDLNSDDIQTYSAIGYILPIHNGNEDTIGWKIAEGIEDSEEIDDRLITAKAWNADGKCRSYQSKDPMQLFRENLKLWIDYPHKLSDSLKKSYEGL